jgi:hypothetical protein
MRDAGFEQAREIVGLFPQGNKWVIVYSRQ